MNKAISQDWSQFKLLGGWLCLDFANTANREESGYSEEWLNNYADLVGWGKYTQILPQKEVKQLLREAKARPEMAKTVFECAIALRETLYRIFSAIAQEHSVPEIELTNLNVALAQTLGNLRIASTDEGFIWTWADSSNKLNSVLWQVIHSAGELLTAKALNRLRECAADDCSFLFVDMSRNRSRCWCDMEDCGNRSKAKRHYERRKRKAL